MDEILVKEDINFLEYPDWVISKKKQIKEFIIRKPKGFYKISTSADTLPTRFDKIILYSLLNAYIDFDEKGFYNIKTTRYKIAKIVYNGIKHIGKTKYERIMLSLERWTSIFIKFEGIFYDGDNYSTRYFHIIDNVVLNDNYLKIDFNKEFLNQIKNTKYYKLINFEEYKRLKRPISARLYEILIKTFKSRNTWKIEIKKLAEKLTLIDVYPSDILRRLNPAINEINKNTELQIDFSTYKNSDDETICVFKNKENNTQTEQMNINFKIDRSESKAYKFVLYEKSKDPVILKIISEFTGDQDVLISNIKYANKNAKDNYAHYLRLSFKNNWGEHIREKERDLKEKYADLIEASMEQTFKLTKGSEKECKELIFESILDMKNRMDDEFYFTPDFIFPIIEEMWERQHYSRKEKTFEELERCK